MLKKTKDDQSIKNTLVIKEGRKKNRQNREIKVGRRETLKKRKKYEEKKVHEPGLGTLILTSPGPLILG